ncbi:MAG: response regulator, partial [Proteobacteria bacterium]|nr:response regulator [Pseudomonadota bacterium]
TVLLIEDDPVGLEIARTRLTGLGCHVHSATTAAGALECLATRDFNLVLLDYNLPDGRGDEIVGRIMSQSALSAPPIVMFSAGLTHAEKQRCLRAGAVGFLEKPAPREGLLAVLERHCRLPVATGTEESTEGFAEDVQVTPALRRVFVRESLTRLAELERATGSRMDLDAVHRTAHTMRSSAGHVGAEALARRFAELDRLATEGQERVVRAKVAETIRHWREIIELLEEVEEHEDATVRLT